MLSTRTEQGFNKKFGPSGHISLPAPQPGEPPYSGLSRLNEAHAEGLSEVPGGVLWSRAGAPARELFLMFVLNVVQNRGMIVRSCRYHTLIKANEIRKTDVLLRWTKDWLGGLDSNQDKQIQNLLYCQLYDLPTRQTEGQLRLMLYVRRASAYRLL
jgi:hypothetical protein